MKIKALVGAAALSALVMSGAAFAQDAASGPGTMAPIPNPPETHKSISHHHGRHVKHHARRAMKHARKHHKAPKPGPAK